MSDSETGGFDRRSLLKMAGVGATAIGTTALLASCSIKSAAPSTSGDVLKIGFVTPQTGPLAGFAGSDSFVIKQVMASLNKGFTAGGKKRQIQIIVKDTQSSATTASQVAKQLITSDKVDLVVSSGTPDTGNPVADQCEAAGVPNVTTIVPWEAWFFGRKGVAGVGFKYSTNFFFGMQEFSETFFPMWDRMGVTSKSVACLYPDDTDANAFRTGLIPLMSKAGWNPIDGGAYADGTTDFSAQISKFKSADAQIYTNAPIPPDFQTYWKQAVQQGYRPKLATVAKVMLFPSEAEALGQLSNNIATDIWWCPTSPGTSTFNGMNCQKLADTYASDTGKQWTQALGSVYSLFEIAVKAFKESSDPKDKDDVADKLQKMKINCISGDLDFTAGPQPGIAIQKPVGGQWRPGKKFPWDITIVDNSANKLVPVGGDLQPTFS